MTLPSLSAGVMLLLADRKVSMRRRFLQAQTQYSDERRAVTRHSSMRTSSVAMERELTTSAQPSTPDRWTRRRARALSCEGHLLPRVGGRRPHCRDDGDDEHGVLDVAPEKRRGDEPLFGEKERERSTCLVVMNPPTLAEASARLSVRARLPIRTRAVVLRIIVALGHRFLWSGRRAHPRRWEPSVWIASRLAVLCAAAQERSHMCRRARVRLKGIREAA